MGNQYMLMFHNTTKNIFSDINSIVMNCLLYRAFLVALLSISILLQVIASIVLMVERMTCRKKDFASCHKYNAAIGCLTIIYIVVNILATAFGGPDNYCARYG